MLFRSPYFARLVAALLVAAFVGCSGVRINDDDDSPGGELLAKAAVPDLFLAALPTGAKTPLSPAQPKPVVAMPPIEPLAVHPFDGRLTAGAALRLRRLARPRRTTLVGTIELRI